MRSKGPEHVKHEAAITTCNVWYSNRTVSRVIVFLDLLCCMVTGNQLLLVYALDTFFCFCSCILFIIFAFFCKALFYCASVVIKRHPLLHCMFMHFVGRAMKRGVCVSDCFKTVEVLLLHFLKKKCFLLLLLLFRRYLCFLFIYLFCIIS